MPERSYLDYRYHPFEIAHRYGSTVHIVADPVSLTRLAVLGRPCTAQPIVNWLIADCYRQLLVAAAAELPLVASEEETRMTASSGVRWQGQVIDPDAPLVCVGIARAGTWPAQICFDALCQLLGPTHVRLDHLYMARSVAASGAVDGTIITGHKVGGTIDGAVLVIPDPMGATAGTIVRAAQLYRELKLGTPRAIVALHLIITPEYVRRVLAELPDLHVYALRLDRGLSPPEVLARMPGEDLARERGLDEHDYIVPGLGGVGEIMNNSFV